MSFITHQPEYFALFALGMSVLSYLCISRTIVFALERVTDRTALLFGKKLYWGIYVAVFIAFLLVASSTGLTVPLTFLSIGTGLATSYSTRSALLAATVSFFVYSGGIVFLLGHYTVLDISAHSEEWHSSYRGERASVVVPATHSVTVSRQRSFFVYYDSVQLYGVGVGSRFDLNPLLTLLPDTRKDASQLRGGHPSSVALGEITHHIVSVGDGTTIAEWGTDAAPPSMSDYIFLSGANSRVVDSVLRCRMMMPAYSDRVSTRWGSDHCIVAAADTHFLNVTVELLVPHAHVSPAEDVSLVGLSKGAHPTVSWRLPDSRGCRGMAKEWAELRATHALLAGWRNPPVYCLPDDFSISDIDELLDGTKKTTMEQLINNMPVLVAWRLYLPRYVHQIQQWTGNWMTVTAIPLLKKYTASLKEGGRQAFGESVRWLVHTAIPWLSSTADYTRLGTLGLYCGMCPERGLCAGCSDFSQKLVEHPWHHFGEWLRRSVQWTAATTLDVLDEVLGMRHVLRLAWDAEWASVRWLYYFSTRAVKGAVQGVSPMGRQLCRSIVYLARASAVTSEVVWGFVRQSAPCSLLQMLVSQLVAEEMREVQTELRYIRWMATYVAHTLAEVVLFVWRGTMVTARALRLCLRLYSGTTMPVHLVLIVMQTAVLLCAMRKEMRDLVSQEECQNVQLLNAPALNSRLSRFIVPRVWHNGLLTRARGAVLFFRLHHRTCARYIVTHLVLLVLLVGFAVLPFMGKQYSLTLYWVLPWMSSQTLMAFFFAKSTTTFCPAAVLFGVKMVLAVALQRTAGDFLYGVVKDMLVVTSVGAGMVAIVWVWWRRSTWAEQVATRLTECEAASSSRQPSQLVEPSSPCDESVVHLCSVADNRGGGK